MGACLTVVIPSRDLCAMLRLCLQHLDRALPGAARAAGTRIVLVDNASCPPYTSSLTAAPAFELLRFDAHHSFSSCCNQGARQAPADFFLFLNNDVLLHERALAGMLSELEAHPGVGICGTRMVFPDDTIQHAGVLFGPGGRGPYHHHQRRPSAGLARARRLCQAVTGACLLVRGRVFAELGGFDEDYPFGGEDIDFCLRAGQRGWQIVCRQEVDSLHFESMTPGRLELDVPSRALFMQRWQGRYLIDGEEARVKLTVLVHARNSEGGLRQLLPTVGWADERVVVDMESTDGTRAVAEAAGARVVAAPYHPRVDGIRNRYLQEAAGDWILVLDSDEYLAADAPGLVRDLVAACGDAYDAVAIPRWNRIGDQVLRGSGWYPDQQVRLFRRGAVRWRDSHHETPEVVTGGGRLLTLQPPDCLHIHHNNYRHLRHFIEKQLHYALHDAYPRDPDEFHFEAYVAAASREFARRYEPQADGDLSKALATVMAWDRIVRGLIHWDQLDPKPPLESIVALPLVVPDPAAAEALRQAHARMAALEHELAAWRSSRAYRLCRWIDRSCPPLSRALVRRLRRRVPGGATGIAPG